eukprot:scaffold2281_cov19-Tisochrysis_lutea.AAC.3
MLCTQYRCTSQIYKLWSTPHTSSCATRAPRSARHCASAPRNSKMRASLADSATACMSCCWPMCTTCSASCRCGWVPCACCACCTTAPTCARLRWD